MVLTFRQAKPTDVDNAAPLIYSAGIEGFEYILTQNKKTALDFLRYAFLEGSGLFGYKAHVAAVDDSRVVGIGAFYNGLEYKAFSIGMGKQIVRFYGLKDCLLVMKRSLICTKIMPPPTKDMEYISSLGVAPDMQGKGIGTALLNRQKKIAKDKNRRIYALDVSVNNPHAQRLYERLGFKITKENRLNGAGGCFSVPDTRRMEINL